MIDGHCHIGPGIKRHLTAEELLRAMDGCRVDKAVICPTDEFIAVLNHEGNDYVMDAVRSHPGRFIGFAAVNPWFGPKAVDEVRRSLDQGLKGLKLNPAIQGFFANDEIVFPIIEVANEFGVPVYCHTGTPIHALPLQVADLAIRFPAVNFIMGHIDAHTHWIERGSSQYNVRIDEFVADMDREGIDAAIVFTLEGFRGDYRRGNNELASLARKYPERFFPFSTVDPKDGKAAIQEIRRARYELGMKGIKLHPWLQAYSPLDPETFAVLETAIELDMAIVLHDGTPPFTGPLEFGYLARLYPEAKIILGHAGLRDMWAEAVRVAKLHANVTLCACGVTQQAFETMVRVVGAERVIFGSDYPFGGRERLRLALMQVGALAVSPEDKKKILGGNIARLIGLQTARGF